MASENQSKTEIDNLSNMLFAIKDKITDNEYKTMYDSLNSVRTINKPPYYKITYLQLEVCVGDNVGDDKDLYTKYNIENCVVLITMEPSKYMIGKTFNICQNNTLCITHSYQFVCKTGLIKLETDDEDDREYQGLYAPDKILLSYEKM